MLVSSFYPELTATVTPCPLPNDRPLTARFARHAENAIPQKITPFPGTSTSGVFHDAFIGHNTHDPPPNKSGSGGGGGGPPGNWGSGSPGSGGKPCSNDPQDCHSASHSHARSTPTPLPSRFPASPTPPSSIQPIPSPIEVSTLQSVGESPATSTNPSTSTSSHPPGNTQSSDTTSITRGVTGTTIIFSLSSSSSFSSTFLGGSSQSVDTAPNISRPPVPTSTYRASPSSGLSTGSVVGLALGVFVALLTLVAALLFLFLRRRRRRRSKRDSAGSNSSRRQLTSEAATRRPSFRLSSISSWLGSVPVGSDVEIDPGYTHSNASSPPRENRFRPSLQEKCANSCSSPLGLTMSMPATPAPVHAQILSPRFLSGFLGPAEVEQCQGLTPAPRPKPEGSSKRLFAMDGS